MDDAGVLVLVDLVLVDEGHVLHVDAQTGEAIHDALDVRRTAEAIDNDLDALRGDARGEGRTRRVIGLVEKLVIVLATRGNQIELEDEETEDEEPGDDRHGTDGNHHEPLRQLGGKGDETGNGLDEAREKRAEARGEQDALEQAVEGGVDHEQDRRRP